MEVKYTITEDKNYIRYFADSTYVTKANDNRIDIDFYVEYVDSVKMIQNQLNADDENLYVIKTKKSSVTLPIEIAIELAHSILEMCKEDNANESEE